MLNILRHPILQRILLTSLSEYLLVGYLLWFWLQPETILAFDPKFAKFLGFLFMFEFIFGHASVFMGLAYLKLGLKGIAGMLLFYSLFFVPLMFEGYFICILLYIIELLARFLRHWPLQNKEEVVVAAGLGFFRVMFLMLSVLIGLMPWPEFGLRPELFEQGDLLLDNPAGMVAFLIFYFGLVHKGERLLAPVIAKVQKFP